MERTVAKTGWMGQAQRQGLLRAGRGCLGPPGGGGNRVRDTVEEQTSPVTSAQPFAYIITASVS